MANPDRLTALDSTFLHLEEHSTAHMHVASVMVFEGAAPAPQELVDHVVDRLHLVPRYRQRLRYVPFDQGRPVWADDPHFNPRCRRPPTTQRSSASLGGSSRNDSIARSRCGRSGSSSEWTATASR